MRLANIRLDGTTRAARADGDTLVVFEDELTDLLRRPGWPDIARAGDGVRVPAGEASFAPLVTKPDKIICAGLNYKGHIAETGRPVPPHPFFFSKFPASLIGARVSPPAPTRCAGSASKPMRNGSSLISPMPQLSRRFAPGRRDGAPPAGTRALPLAAT